MSKVRHSLLSFLLIFSILAPGYLLAEDLVGLKNLSWEEQKNKTRIILETNKPLLYNVTSSQTSTEVQVELANLDLRNLPQELFISTDEVVSLQTFPQSTGQKAKIIVKMTSVRPYHVSTEGNVLYVDVEGNPDGDGLLAPVTTALPPQPENNAGPQSAPEAEKMAEVQQPPAVETPVPAPAETEVPAEPAEELKTVQTTDAAPATIVRDVKINQDTDRVDVVLIGDGSFDYDVFELNNPHRIVVDLKSVTVAPNVKSITSSGHEMFSRVRVAQYQTSPKVARAVIDLNEKVPYSVLPDGTELRIHLGEKIEPQPVSTNTVEEPAATEAPAIAETQLPEQSSDQPQTAAPEPVEMASTPPLENEPQPDQPVAQPAAQTNEQFFSYQPDTSLFAQEGGSTQETGTATTGTTTEGTGSGFGMGSFQTDTISSGEKQYTGEPFSFDFKDIDIKDLFRFIADISGLNVILDPAVKGSVTLKLTEVPWDQALELICKNQGLGYTIEGNVIRIAPIQKIADEERKRADAIRQQMLNAPIVTKVKYLSYARAADVDRVVRRLLTQKGTSIIDNRTNAIIVTEINTNVDQIINLIDTLDSRTPQVLIEARIVETNKNFTQAFGIQWGFRGIVDPAFGNNTTLQFPNNMVLGGNTLIPTSGITGNPLGGYAVNLPTQQAPNSALLLSAGNILDTFRLDVALMALENTGRGRILSSPKVATQNNTKAEILQGTQIPVQTIANNTITTTFVNAALHMSVTPQITAEGTVIMEVTIENNQPDFANPVGAAGGTPPIITEKATTTLLVEDGGTTVIGGIFRATDNYAQARTPILHRIPLLGWLFKNTNISRTNNELLIFITPRILR